MALFPSTLFFCNQPMLSTWSRVSQLSRVCLPAGRRSSLAQTSNTCGVYTAPVRSVRIRKPADGKIKCRKNGYRHIFTLLASTWYQSISSHDIPIQDGALCVTGSDQTALADLWHKVCTNHNQ